MNDKMRPTTEIRLERVRSNFGFAIVVLAC